MTILSLLLTLPVCLPAAFSSAPVTGALQEISDDGKLQVAASEAWVLAFNTGREAMTSFGTGHLAAPDRDEWSASYDARHADLGPLDVTGILLPEPNVVMLMVESRNAGHLEFAFQFNAANEITGMRVDEARSNSLLELKLDSDDPRPARDIDDYLPIWGPKPLEYEPGTREPYSNYGYTVLGAVLEQVTGMSYPEYVAARVFKPAGMNSSGFFEVDGIEPNVAVGYTFMDGRGRRLDRLHKNIFMEPIKGGPWARAIRRAGTSSASSMRSTATSSLRPSSAGTGTVGTARPDWPEAARDSAPCSSSKPAWR